MSMTPDQLNTLLSELFELDPELRLHEEEVRVLVTKLSSVRPTVPLSNAFLIDLRERLLETPRPVSHTQHMGFSVWMLRLAPLTAIALIVLIVAPSLRTQYRAQPDREAVPHAEVEETMPRTYTQPSTAPEGGGASFKTMSAPALNASVIALPQHSGTTVTIDTVSMPAPGFVVVYADMHNFAGASPIGMSQLISESTAYQVSVPLFRRSRSGEELYAVLVSDNGDGVFNDRDDQPVQDSFQGGPMYAVIPIDDTVPDYGNVLHQ